jgi:hypothetical protein
MKSLNLEAARSIPPVISSDDSPLVGEWVDINGYSGLLFIIAAGVLSDSNATFAVLVEDANADDKSDAAAVEDGLLIGTEAQAGFNYSNDHAMRKIGYKGLKRWVRLTILPSGNGGAAAIASAAVLGFPVNASP